MAMLSFRHRFAAMSVVAMAVLCNAVTPARGVTWGVNGAGGSGTWNTSTANWFNGVTNVTWPSNGDAVFAGASGGTVSSFTFGPIVKSMTFNTPGYVIQNGWVQSGTNGLTVTTNAPATISSLLSDSSSAGNFLIKNGPAALTLNGTNFFGSVAIQQGELVCVDTNATFFSSFTLADAAGVYLTVAPTSSSFPISIEELKGGGTTGGIVRPDNQARTVTVSIGGNGTFAGQMTDNGAGILAVQFFSAVGTQTLTNVNPYSGATEIDGGTVALSGNGSLPNTSVSISASGTLLLDNSGSVLADRLADSRAVTMDYGSFALQGNATTPVEEMAGELDFRGAASIEVVQPGSAATELTFAGLNRSGHGTLSIAGTGVKFAGLTNGSTGIVAPYVTAGTEWATVGGDGRITAWTAYATDINGASTTDQVKIATTGITSLASDTTRASLNLQNASASVGQSLDLAAHNLELSTGGLLSSGAGTTAVSGGTLSTASQELIVTAINNLTIGAQIVDHGGPTTFTKTGAGTVVLTNANTYSGPTVIKQGTLVVSSDANLGTASSIELNYGTLKAAASFTSPKGFTSPSSYVGGVDTNGFDVTFTGPISGAIAKRGEGTLTLTTPTLGYTSISGGTLVLPHVTSADIHLSAGTLQAAGTISTLEAFANSNQRPIIDIGGPAAATLAVQYTLELPIFNSLQFNFGIGSAASDLFVIPYFISSSSQGPSFYFNFQNLGGVTTGVDYLLVSGYFSGAFPPSNVAAFSAESIAAGWAGTFTATNNGLSVRFSAVPVPEPGSLLLMTFGLAAFGCYGAHRRRSAAK